MNNKPVVMSIQSYDYMLDAFLKYDVDVMRPERKLFKDGESYHRMPDLSDRGLILIGGTIDDSSTLELYDMASHASNTARSMKIIVPFYGYATMERAVNSGEIVKAKSRAELLSSIPRAQVKNTFLFLDLHTEGLPYYLHGVNVEHVYAKDAISEVIDDIKQMFLYAAETPARKNPMVLASTDGGRTKWIESLAADFNMDSAFLTKRHTDDGTEVTSINANVRGKVVCIFDDMTRSGSSLSNAANIYKKEGASEIYAITTHAPLTTNPTSTIATLFHSKIKQLHVLDTHPRALAVEHQEHNEFFIVHYKTGEIFAKHLRLTLISEKPNELWKTESHL